MLALFPILIIDICCLLFTLIIMRHQLAFYHPFFMYLFFHVIVVSMRGWQLYYGAPPLYADYSQFQTVTVNEIYKAISMADVALVVFAMFSWMGKYSIFKANVPQANIPNHIGKMNQKYTHYVCYLCLPLGLIFFIIVQAGALNLLPKSSYFTVLAQWLICCLLMLIFIHGFKLIYVIPSTIYLMIIALQGYHRTQLILPLIFLTCLYLHNKKKKWPPALLSVAMIIGMIIFPQLKNIGVSFQQGNYQEALFQLSKPFNSQTGTREPQKFNFLDQFAGALTLKDQAKKQYYGSTYLSLLTLPIPRAIWPNKPGLADHIIETSTFNRPYGKEGKIITYIGESYYNFGYFGLLIMPAFLSFILSRWYHRTLYYPKRSLSLCLWLVVFSSLIQVFRDGLSSLITFTIMINTPLFFVALLTLTNKKLKGH